ncbi:MAG: hypothetical protein ACYC7F_04220 [Gemmatimonadaceae bacterium]
MTLRSSLLIATAVLAACKPAAPPATAPEPVAALLENSDLCYLVQAEAAKAPSLEVDRAPDVVKYEPRPLTPPRGGYPRNVIRRDGTTKVKVSVVVDTVGHADMSTFTVIETTHPWLANNLKATIPKWTFTPAYKNGCRVAGLWVFTAAPGQRPKAAPAVRKPAKKPAPKPVRKPGT